MYLTYDYIRHLMSQRLVPCNTSVAFFAFYPLLPFFLVSPYEYPWYNRHVANSCLGRSTTPLQATQCLAAQLE
jgi:hypothetical protein